MQSLWRDDEAAQYPGDLGQRVYTSRLLGRDRTLVLHGGGNTSVKIDERDRFGNAVRVLYVKGSGWDLETIEARGFSPVRLDHVERLAQLDALSDPDMVSELTTNMLASGAPTPSVETILHAAIPHRFVDHTHADAVLAVTNTPSGEARVREIYGDDVLVIPYLMPGFDLARHVALEFGRRATARTIGMVLLRHGVFSFGATARESYERMIALVSRAETYLQAHGAWDVKRGDGHGIEPVKRVDLASLRQSVSALAGTPLVMRTRSTPATLAFARHPEVRRISQQGPATPDHVIRTKPTPMLDGDPAAFAADYRTYFAANAAVSRAPKTMLDPAPRMALDPRFGLASLGRTARDAAVVEELYEHTMDVILRAEALERYEALPARDVFDVEYWDLEQNKLRQAGRPPVFAGEVALVTGAASGIGKACVDALLRRGAAVVGLDLAPEIRALHDRVDFLAVQCDVTDADAVGDALDRTVRAFGGVDMLVLNAGVFGPTCSIADLADDQWREIMNVNVDAVVRLMREAHPLLARAPRSGRVVVVASKNVPAPGPGAAAYSASKAALTQLARVAALEWGKDSIRVNVIHPNAVFDTALWTDEVLAERAARYGMSVDAYKRNNVLRVEVTSRDVAELAAEMLGPVFARTTGAQVPVDGGNERVI
jgi:rhamnose utilization protein RhaD (predicted bifunctional aldolase and dehydrogenase)/NAD(P)-dependent dehydrogenase (short-subunit alcohol dehydrogenase family)